MKERRRTSTSNFGSGAREAHDASAFYERFSTPELSDDDTVLAPEPVAEPFVCGDARNMAQVTDGSVALVVTSPPYFAGKQYEEELERDGVPASYLEYLDMLRSVFAECVRTLEPGGRIAVIASAKPVPAPGVKEIQRIRYQASIRGGFFFAFCGNYKMEVS